MGLQLVNLKVVSGLHKVRQWALPNRPPDPSCVPVAPFQRLFVNKRRGGLCTSELTMIRIIGYEVLDNMFIWPLLTMICHAMVGVSSSL